jgi:hypothetical protein
MHELGPEPNFNESMYFNVFDADRRTGGFFRLGNRPNEGSGEMTTCVYLPDGLEPSSSSTSHLTWPIRAPHSVPILTCRALWT